MSYPHETSDEMVSPATYQADTKSALADIGIDVDSEDYNEPDYDDLRDLVSADTMLDMDDVDEYAARLHEAMESGYSTFRYEVWYT